VTQKYGDPTVRQKAIDQLGQMKYPEAITALLSRFTVTVEPQTTDAEEKEQAFKLICAQNKEAVKPVLLFLQQSDQASSWALRILAELLPAEEVTARCLDLLKMIGPDYSRDPQKKLVLLGHLEGNEDGRVADTVLPFLEDMLDDVKVAALKLLGPLKHERSREPILKLLVAEDTSKRVRMAATVALHASGFGVQGFREKVESQLAEPYFVDKSGLIKKRG
jgi:hypothetical protein